MIRFLLVLLWCVLPSLAQAAPVVVKSGEHDGFTRLVMDFGKPVDWTVGRSLDGYVLHLSGAIATYDLTEAFALIGKGRLAALWADPDSGDLRLGIACACYAMPFEFRPGIIVMDLKDGPAPKGSSFELSVDGSIPPALAARNVATIRPRPRPDTVAVGYDWLQTRAYRSKPPKDDEARLEAIPDPVLEPLRESLLWQMSKGAAAGIVDMTSLPKAESPSQSDHAAAVATRLDDETAANLSTSSDKVAAQGQPCITNDALDIASWGSDLPIADQLAGRMDGLVGEFDRPEPDAVAKAVRLNLFLGFGAEARQLLEVFPVAAQDRAIWSSLAHLLDDDRDERPVFAGLAACDTSAALWAVLSEEDLPKGDLVNAPAVLLAFSGLPLHLRKQLAPRLTDRFLAMHDQNSASAVRDAVLRAKGQEGGNMALVQANIKLDQHDAKAAEAALAPVLADPGSAAPEVLIGYIEARAAQDLPVKPELVPALAGFIRETPEGSGRQRMRRALTLAQAASGDFDAAFSGNVADQSPDLWRLLAKLGADAAVLTHAIRPEGAFVETVDDATSQLLAARLLDLGFPRPAAGWLGNQQNIDPVLAAKVAIGQGNPRTALRVLAGTNAPEAETLRRAALGQMRDDRALAGSYARAGEGAAESAALARAGDWQKLADSGEGPWQALAATLKSDAEMPPAGPLEAAHRLIEAGEKTQTAIVALLANVPMPTPR